jgi:hypothetical protein
MRDLTFLPDPVHAICTKRWKGDVLVATSKDRCQTHQDLLIIVNIISGFADPTEATGSKLYLGSLPPVLVLCGLVL